MGVAVRDKKGVTAIQREGGATLHTQKGAAVADKMELGFAGRLVKRHAKRRAGLNPTVFHARQAHAPQKFADQIG
ncbi:hypothetical protein ENT52713_18490 [Enterobacter sp. 200527-13]|nr:hypothetical protein ENT52713_18490 [Enterobacter sp. 200527-13]